MDTVADQPCGGIGWRTVNLQHAGILRHAARFQMVGKRFCDGVANALVIK